MKYMFEYDEIVCCSECPFYYDFIYCLLEPDKRPFDNYTWLDDGHRPEFCPLIETGE